MQELEKILEEIDIKISGSMGKKREGLLEARDVIRKHMDAGWIPVKEALPPEPPEYVDDEDDLEQCIVMIDGAERPTTLRYAGDGTWWEDGTYYPVIAWRPFPEPYRPEKEHERVNGVKLKPCPFCGSEDIQEGNRTSDLCTDIYIRCRTCGGKMQICEEYGEKELAKRWNRRAGEQNE